MVEPRIEAVHSVPELTVAKPSRFQSFTLNHPRTAKVVGLVAITTATLGVISVVKNRRQIGEELKEHGEELKDSLTDSSDSV